MNINDIKRIGKVMVATSLSLFLCVLIGIGVAFLYTFMWPCGVVIILIIVWAIGDMLSNDGNLVSISEWWKM